MHTIAEHGGIKVGMANDFLKLPTGDWIRPTDVTAIRVSLERADKQTGEIGVRVYIQAGGSWYTVRFVEARCASLFADALAMMCDRIARGETEQRHSALSRREALGLVGELTGEHVGDVEYERSVDNDE